MTKEYNAKESRLEDLIFSANWEHASRLKNFPPMKYQVGDFVEFEIDHEDLQGKIVVADFGGSMENDYHSYDVSVEGRGWYKHIPERMLPLVESVS
jgi:hypothetical protein